MTKVDKEKGKNIDASKQIKIMTETIEFVFKEWLDSTGVIPQGTSYYAECLGCAEDAARRLWKNGFRDVYKERNKLKMLEIQNEFLSEASIRCKRKNG